MTNKTDRAIKDMTDLARSMVGVVNDYFLPANSDKPNRVSDTISDLESMAETIKERATELWTLAQVDYPDEVGVKVDDESRKLQQAQKQDVDL